MVSRSGETARPWMTVSSPVFTIAATRRGVDDLHHPAQEAGRADAAAEHRDGDGHGDASSRRRRYSRTRFAAVAVHEKRATLAVPAATRARRRSSSPSTRTSAPARASVSPSGTNSAPSPATSGIEPARAWPRPDGPPLGPRGSGSRTPRRARGRRRRPRDGAATTWRRCRRLPAASTWSRDSGAGRRGPRQRRACRRRGRRRARARRRPGSARLARRPRRGRAGSCAARSFRSRARTPARRAPSPTPRSPGAPVPGDRERAEVDDRHPLGAEQVADLIGGRRAGRVDPCPVRGSPPQHGGGSAHGRRRQAGVGEEPAVVHRDHLRQTARGHDVVGAVDDLGRRQPAVDAWPVGVSPQRCARPAGRGSRRVDGSGRVRKLSR